MAEARESLGALEEYRRKRDFQRTPEPSGDEAGAADPSADRRPGRGRRSRMGGLEPDGDRESWLLIKRRDGEAAGPDAPPVTEDRPLSVLSGRDLERIAADRERLWTREGEAGPAGGPPATAPPPPGAPSELEGAREAPLPGRTGVQLATLVSEPPAGEHWLHEIKFDGYRLLARVEEGRVRLLTRGGKDWTDRFPGLAEIAASLAAGTALVDGEAVVLDRRGVSDFQAVQNAMGERREDLFFYAFDLLHLDGHDLSGVPLEDRKRTLRLLLAASDVGSGVRYSDHVRGRGGAFYREACEAGLEGIVSKRAGTPYREGRTRAWLKTKCVLRQEFVVVLQRALRLPGRAGRAPPRSARRGGRSGLRGKGRDRLHSRGAAPAEGGARAAGAEVLPRRIGAGDVVARKLEHNPFPVLLGAAAAGFLLTRATGGNGAKG